jgi:hypothetical protein
VSRPSELNKDQKRKADALDLVKCWQQAKPARELPHLQGIPILTTEASYHAQYGQCKAQYLTQADVKNDFLRHEEAEIHGNSHIVMLELNNLRVAGFVAKWARQHADWY